MTKISGIYDKNSASFEMSNSALFFIELRAFETFVVCF